MHVSRGRRGGAPSSLSLVLGAAHTRAKLRAFTGTQEGREGGKPAKSPAPFRAEAEFIANCYFHQVGAKVGEAGEKREVERGKRGQRGGKSGNQLITLGGGGGGGGGAFNGRRHRLFVLSALEGFFLTKEEKGPDF